jgi:hypothetical protein
MTQPQGSVVRFAVTTQRTATWRWTEDPDGTSGRFPDQRGHNGHLFRPDALTVIQEIAEGRGPEIRVTVGGQRVRRDGTLTRQRTFMVYRLEGDLPQWVRELAAAELLTQLRVLRAEVG